MALWKKKINTKEWLMTPSDVITWRDKISKEYREGYVIKELTSILQEKGLHIGGSTFRTGLLQCLHQACLSGAFSFVKYIISNHIREVALNELHSFYSKQYYADDKCMTISDEAQHRKESLLHAAIIGDSTQSVEIVNFLLSQCDALIKIGSCCSQSPLMLALETQNEEVISVLLGHRMIELNCQDMEGSTPLMYAARITKMAHFIPKMIKLGANLFVTDKRGYNTLHVAVSEHNTKAVEFLLAQNDCKTFLTACPLPIYLIDQSSFLSQKYGLMGEDMKEVYRIITSSKLDLSLERNINMILLKATFFVIGYVKSGSQQLLVNCKHALYEAFTKGSLESGETESIPLYSGHKVLLTLNDVKSMYSSLNGNDLEVALCYESLIVRERCLCYGDPSLICSLLSFGVWFIWEAKKLSEGLQFWLRGTEMLLHVVRNCNPISSQLINLVVTMLQKLLSLAEMDNSSDSRLDLWSEKDILISVIENAILCVTNCVILTKNRHTHLITHKSFLPGVQLILESLNAFLLSTTEESDIKYLVDVLSKNCPRTIIDANGLPTTLIHVLLRLDSVTGPLKLLQLIIEANGVWMVNGVGPLGMRPLHLTHEEDIISLLIDYGAHLDAVNSHRVTVIKDLHVRRPDLFPDQFIDSRPFPLKCLAANAIAIQALPYIGMHIPHNLKYFISLHDHKAEDQLLRSQLDFSM
uniref:Uncharacterized protein n=1 Tax=Amphimedon queenslandica TaxID=400682 RepID=A0A1X7VJA1_AMPQE